MARAQWAVMDLPPSWLVAHCIPALPVRVVRGPRTSLAVVFRLPSNIPHSIGFLLQHVGYKRRRPELESPSSSKLTGESIVLVEGVGRGVVDKMVEEWLVGVVLLLLAVVLVGRGGEVIVVVLHLGSSSGVARE